MSAKSEFEPPGFERTRQMLAVRAADAASSGSGQRPYWGRTRRYFWRCGSRVATGTSSASGRLALRHRRSTVPDISPAPCKSAVTQQEARLRLHVSLAR